MRLARHIIGLLIMSFISAPTADANWRGRPLPQKDFLITEFGMALRTSSLPAREDPPDPFVHHADQEGQRWFLTAELGYMENVSRTVALGATFYSGFEDYGSRMGVGPRVRFWLTPDARNVPISVDLTPTLLIRGESNELETRFPSFSGSVALNFGDILALSARAEAMRVSQVSPDKEWTDWGWYLGARGGSWLGVVSGAAFFAFLLVAFS